VRWVSVGATIGIAQWVIVSLAFYVYLVDIADYDSIFGSLVFAIAAVALLYLSATVLVFCAQSMRSSAPSSPAAPPAPSRDPSERNGRSSREQVASPR
jgi:uncharacterized BrkB/YihY/UPF0761 family membrane protein